VKSWQNLIELYEAWDKPENSGEQSCRKRKLWRSDITNAKSPLSGAVKHPDFQVTSCHHFDTTNVDFAYIESE